MVDDFVYRSEFLLEHESEQVKFHIVQHFSVKKILLVGTAFQCSVWRAVFSIPAGKKVSYTDIAHMVNAPRSVRAVANALGDNKIAYFIPCHRVLRKTGDVCGYYWGVEKKEALLKSEGAL
jgi:AraC family transcriptional regulator of adaptative response/methylated-DNA-[protein]-cysteine methyltransferase